MMIIINYGNALQQLLSLYHVMWLKDSRVYQITL